MKYLGILMDAFFIALLLHCSFTDIKCRTITNRSIALLLIVDTMNLAIISLHRNSWWIYLIGALPAASFIPAWLKNKIGAGDIKLIGACGLYSGFAYALWGCAIMLPIVIVLYVRERRHTENQSTSIPFAPVIAVGMIGAVLLKYIVPSS